MSQLRKVIDKENPKIIVLTGGLLAGFSEIITTYPLDTVKTNLQIYPEKYKNTYDCFKKIITKNGIRPLFNGMSASLVQVGGKAAIRFTIYDQINLILNKNNKKSNLNNLISGMLAGTVESILWTAPTERIKILQQKNTKKTIKTITVLNKILNEKGILNLYQGTVPTILKQSTSVGARFWMYSYLKQKLVKENETISVTKTMLIGGISGSFSAAINQPFDVIKSNIQCNKEKISIIKAIKLINKKSGLLGFFNGLNARILRVGIAQAVTFAVYETYVSNMKHIYFKNEK